MYSRINLHASSPYNIQRNINNFLIEIHNYLLATVDIPAPEVQADFYIMVDNFQAVMNYLCINEKWIIKNIYLFNKPDIRLIQHVHQHVQTLLTTSIINAQYNNLIFEFHRHIPFTETINQTYKLLINSILTMKTSAKINIQLILSAYLTNAIIYNNYYAINILLEEYNVCPAKPWLELPTAYKRFNLTILPITQITNTDQIAIRESFFKVTWQLQEYNFMIMLNKIDFSSESIKSWHVQEIFECAFKNFFLHAINYLLEQKMFCRKFEIKEDIIIMMAFGLIILPKYDYLINIILHHPNIINTTGYNIQNIKQSLNYFTKTLNKMIMFKVTNENHNFIPLKVVSDFIRTLLVSKNYEEHVSPEFLITIHNEIEKLKQENNLLLQHQKILEELETRVAPEFLLNVRNEIEELKQKNGLLLQYTTLLQELEIKLNKLEVDAKTIKHEHNLLLHKYYVLLRKTNYIHTNNYSLTIYTIENPPAITEHNNYLTQFNNRRHSFYL